MLTKAGVDIGRLRAEIRRILPLIEKSYNQREDEVIITSTYEGTHGVGSLHYANLAIDIRYPRKYKGTITAELKASLGDKFDVVPEATHIHIEYDPK